MLNPVRIPLTILLTASFFLVAQAQYKKIKVFSPKHNRDVEVAVYLPPGYENGRERYPVVYNLHGGSGSPDTQWGRMGKTITDAIEKNRVVKPMIYVWTTSFVNIEFRDVPSRNLYPSTFLMKELIPFIDKNYRTIASREGRGIDGFSMGGFGALHHAFKFPEFFSAVASYGGAINLNRPGDHPREFAEKNQDFIRKNLKIRLVYGKSDKSWGGGSVDMSNFLKKLNIEHDLIALDIGHDTGGMYQRVGTDAMKWMQSIFKMPDTGPVGPTPTPNPTVPPSTTRRFDLELEEGWNLISLPLSPKDRKIATLLGASFNSLQVVYSYNTSSEKYLSFTPNERSDFTTFEMGNGYWVYMDKAARVTIEGDEINPAVAIKRGWNLVGVNSPGGFPVDAALKSIEGKFSIVYSYTSSNGGYKSYIPGDEAEFDELLPGAGYWLYATENTSWKLPITEDQ
jgi:enterochelin esterase-like enzyme